ncbi:phage tail sheath subtilisin-like domain-containing protein, partial [uncultured Deefgea sp.]|uniref:phage tail sheath subtilisin-like domain-containing protein n=1 Tax=uncultured Deefgea sp. TaxID=1304914 RepID=UPI0025956C09
MASPNISFDTLPSSIKKPGKYIEFNTKLAVRTLPGNLQKLVLIGQRLATGSVLAGVPTDVFSDTDAAVFFGRGSHLHNMAAAALAANPYLQLSCVALDDAVGTAASCTVTFTGTATAAGTITLWIADCRVDLPVSVGDAAATEAAALKAALDALPDLPVSAIAAAGVVTLTAKNKGTLGNQIKVSASAWQATGLTVVATPMAAGATDPDLQTALSAIFSAGHHVIGTSLNDSANLTKLRTHLDNVSAALEQRGAVAAYGFTGTLAASTTLAATINSGRITCGLLPGTISLPWEVAAAYAAVIAFEEDPARPLNTLALTGIVAPP